jgi:hypothetical protein
MRNKKILFLKEGRFVVTVTVRRESVGPNQPNSSPAIQKADQMPTDAGQKMKPPADSGCEKAAAVKKKKLAPLPRPSQFYAT